MFSSFNLLVPSLPKQRTTANKTESLFVGLHKCEPFLVFLSNTKYCDSAEQNAMFVGTNVRMVDKTDGSYFREPPLLKKTDVKRKFQCTRNIGYWFSRLSFPGAATLNFCGAIRLPQSCRNVLTILRHKNSKWRRARNCKALH